MAKPTRIIALIAGLLLFAGQLSSIVHATEHPFHENSQICVSMISLEQHDLVLSAISLAVDVHRYVGEVATGLRPLMYSLPLYSGHARAPPLTT